MQDPVTITNVLKDQVLAGFNGIQLDLLTIYIALVAIMIISMGGWMLIRAISSGRDIVPAATPYMKKKAAKSEAFNDRWGADQQDVYGLSDESKFNKNSKDKWS